MVTINDLKKYADKLMFDMNDEEYTTLLKEFDFVLKHMDIINSIDGINQVEPMHYPYKVNSVILRDDAKTINIPVSDVIKNSSDTFSNQIKIPKVVE